MTFRVNIEELLPKEEIEDLVSRVASARENSTAIEALEDAIHESYEDLEVRVEYVGTVQIRRIVQSAPDQSDATVSSLPPRGSTPVMTIIIVSTGIFALLGLTLVVWRCRHLVRTAKSEPETHSNPD